MEFRYEFEKDLPVLIQEWTPSTMVETFHWHTPLEIGYCQSGKGWFYFGDKTFRVMPGDIYVVNNMERHIAQSDADDPSRYLFLYFDPEFIEQGEKELLLPFVYNPGQFRNQISSGTPTAKAIGALVMSMEEECRERRTGYKSMIRGGLLQICALLLRHYGLDTPRDEINRIFNQYHMLQPALSLMKERFREPIALEDVARVLLLSPSRTRHLFKEILGEGFKAYLTQLRINEAKRLLITTALPVTEICLQCGFQSFTPFYRAFRQIVGQSPQDYRERASVLAVLAGTGE
ncbi:helix-turn-helix transcriptional regulator [Paenibacillus sp. GCM10023250]|uniref:helix-turn-helix transcriptional regulator n=1 Tax=Paenibacillus sp. GCM10023250 TaxID=3252648 RepID=UPI00360B0207